jgi:hypothetical protein
VPIGASCGVDPQAIDKAHVCYPNAVCSFFTRKCVQLNSLSIGDDCTVGYLECPSRSYCKKDSGQVVGKCIATDVGKRCNDTGYSCDLQLTTCDRRFDGSTVGGKEMIMSHCTLSYQGLQPTAVRPWCVYRRRSETTTILVFTNMLRATICTATISTAWLNLAAERRCSLAASVSAESSTVIGQVVVRMCAPHSARKVLTMVQHLLS